MLETGTHVEGVHVFRHIELMGGVGEYLVGFLMLVHKRGAQGDVGAVLLQFLRPFVEVQLQVAAGYPGVVVGPVAALLAGEGFYCYTLERTVHHAAAQQRVVDAEAALLVGAQDEAGAELLVEVTGRHLDVLVVAFHEYIRHTPSFDVVLITREGVFQKFESGTGVDVLTVQIEVGISVGQCPVVVFLGTDGLVFLRDEHIALNTSAQRKLPLLLLCRQRGRQAQKGQQTNMFSHYFTSSRTF